MIHLSRFNGLRRTTWGVACLVAIGLTGCGAQEAPPARLDSAGKRIDATPRRVVCGSPAVAEIVFAIGCGDRVIGVSDYTMYPPEATAKPRTGGWINPNRERLLVMQPDLIIGQGQHKPLAAFCDEYDIRFHTVRIDNLDDLYGAIDSIAETLDVPDRGTALNKALRDTMRCIAAKAASSQPKRVLLLVGRTHGNLSGLTTVGPGAFLDDLIRVAGGSNLFADAAGTYPRISKETLLVRRPDVILEINPGLERETIAHLRADWAAFNEQPAVRNGRICYLTNDFLLIPGPRVGRSAMEFARAIHPEIFRD